MANIVVCRQEHPEVLEEITGSSAGTYLTKQFGVAVPPKTITTMQIYINEKCEEEQKKGSKVIGGKSFTSTQAQASLAWLSLCGLAAAKAVQIR